jgi:hypothetical protein
MENYLSTEKNMLPETLAEFFRLQGHRIHRSESCFWYDIQPGFYFSIPYHRLITPSKEEINGLLWGLPCIALRFFTTVECTGKSSYMIVCSDKNYDITSIDPKYARRQTRRGLENFQIRQLDFIELANHNHINVDTLIRQGRKPGVWTDKRWKRYCLSANGLSGLEAWGAYSGDILVAFLVAYEMDDYFEILHHSSTTEYLHLYPNNALVFFVTKLKLSTNHINYVSYGPESIDAPESLETFKFRMGFERLPMKQGIIFHPFVKPVMNKISYKIVKRISKSSTSDFWRKLEGIFRFYIEGGCHKI